VARRKGAQRQKNQLKLAFEEGMRSEAPNPSRGGTEASRAKSAQNAGLRMSRGWRLSARERTCGRLSSV
jgi:hypothetical protein